MERPGVIVSLRPLQAADLAAVMAIEEGSFAEPWSRSLFAGELAQPSRRYVAAFDGPALCGYGGIMLVGEDAHVVTLAVGPAWRQRGIASQLMIGLIETARAEGARHLTLEVRESNEAAIHLYRKFAFEPAGRRKGYYTTEDAVVMWAIDIDSAGYEHTLSVIREEAS